ncbi:MULTISPECIES: hypothetical protein [Haloarcula]|jgi:hypothetical protein|uniref:Type IV pilin n=4 Tax=Haloarcula marismortui TaxID=2238 RepID=Q5V2A2_HALMA|nr:MULTISPECIES: hypothetical protein [Haloarcula]AAV46350.1 unknown [Haloarcula marismortui ATCC 43049]EMA26688.1 hypothetical protein C435_01274 [Haloarcula californiae ATCC 33799]NHX41343.1 hypothetical protein [Haloarcula sp. R1-2]QCP91083.1 hypothetical protein E6P14_09515 [Haloarcula marismortui ATCC 43049]QUJ72814.1 hypothetical protein KDQ40_03410 [Haloarcula sinaiiensis ATCC 33800]
MADRAVSEVLSFALVFSLIVASIILVSVSGLGALQNARDAEQMENAERAFDVLSDNIADLHKQGAPSRATEVSLGEASLRTGENTTISVHVHDGTAPKDVGTWEIRPIIYAGNQERELVYEAGAVYRTNRDGGVQKRTPPILVSDDRVLITVVGTTASDQQSLGGSTVLVRTNHRSSNVSFADTDGNIEHVNISVDSAPQREALWQSYFESEGFTCAANGWCNFTSSSGDIQRTYVVYHDIAVEIDQ